MFESLGRLMLGDDGDGRLAKVEVGISEVAGNSRDFNVQGKQPNVILGNIYPWEIIYTHGR